MKDFYNILNNQDKVAVKHCYHIRCDPDLGRYFYAMQRIPYASTGCVEQLFNPCLPNRDQNLQLQYAIKPETCK